MQTATPGKLASSGALSPVTGHNLTLSASGGLLMFPGPLRMECISSEDGTAGRPQNLWRRMGQWRTGSVSNMIQGKINTANNIIFCYFQLWQVCLCHPRPRQWGGNYHWRMGHPDKSLSLQQGWTSEGPGKFEHRETLPCLHLIHLSKHEGSHWKKVI